MIKREDSELKIFAQNGGYIFHEGKLESVKFIKTKFELAEWDEDYGAYYKAQSYVELHSTGEVIRVDYDKVYDSVKKYERNETAETHYCDIERVIARNISYGKSCKIESTANDDAHSVITYKFYEFVDGQPIECKRKLRTFQFHYPTSKWSAIDEIFTDSEVTYRTRYEALNHNEYEVVNADGTKEKRTGTNKLLQLDDDQQALIDELKSVLGKITKANIELVADCDGEYYALNSRNVKDFAYCYEDPYDNGEGKWEEVEQGYEYSLGGLIEIYSSDSVFWVKR